jgi:hypothetical protein
MLQDGKGSDNREYDDLLPLKALEVGKQST